jgi:hypothetical protein
MLLQLNIITTVYSPLGREKNRKREPIRQEEMDKVMGVP